MSKEIENLVSNLAKARSASEAAEEKLNAKLESVPLGTVFDVNGEKMHVTQDRKNKKDANSPMVRRLVPVLTARQRAILAGEPIPSARYRKSKAEVEAERIAEAKRILEAVQKNAT